MEKSVKLNLMRTNYSKNRRIDENRSERREHAATAAKRVVQQMKLNELLEERDKLMSEHNSRK